MIKNKGKILFSLIGVAIGAFMFASCQNKPEERNGFTVKDGALIDANGNEFVIRGVNMPHAWMPEKSYKALDLAAELKTNCIRIVWEYDLPLQRLDSILEKCVDLKMIPMVELHDVTGDSTASGVLKMASWYASAEMQRLTSKYEKYILLNIANEWGNHGTTAEYWRDAYQECIVKIRQSGCKSVLVIDGPGWGQNIEPILKYGNDLLNFDPEHNLVFSIHMYGSWNDEAEVASKLQEVKQLSLPFIIGEFGYNYKDGDNNLHCKVNHRQLLGLCNELNIGYLPWSWTGNNKENAWLDMFELEDWKTLTWWGEEVYNGKDGIVETSKKATVFN